MERLWSRAVATARKPDSVETRSNTPIGNRWQPAATVSERMVWRGSTVRVRQRALQKRRNRRFLVQTDLLRVERAVGMEPFMELSRRRSRS
jgi:hypothetical protein